MFNEADLVQKAPDSFNFGPFVLNRSEHLLLCEGKPVALAPKVYELLVVLVENHGRVALRETLMRTVWPDSFVEETNLTVNISILRKILGDLPDGRPYIGTVPKRGYRFDAPVTYRPAPRESPAHETAEDGQERVPAPVPENLLQSAHASATLDAPAVRGPQAFEHRSAGWLSKRFGSTGIVVLFAVLIVAVATGWFAFRQVRSYRAAAAGIHTLAVLPFQTLGSKADDEYLGLGMTDALIRRMGRLQQIVVRPFGAVRPLTNVTDPVRAGQSLQADAVLDGTIQRLGDQTRVTVQLTRVSNGETLWTDSFDDQTANAFALEDSISQKLVQALTLRLSDAEEQNLSGSHKPTPEAYALYTQGRFDWNKRSVESVQQSIGLFKQAVAADPSYAAAYSGLADAYILAASYGNSFLAPQMATPKAREAAEKALSLDSASAEAHTSLAYILLTYEWDWAGAEKEFKQAIALSPGYVNAHHWYAHELMALGRIREAHEESETALALDPTDTLVNEHMAWHHLMAREYDRAIPQAIKAIELDPEFVQAHRVLGLAYQYTGRYSDATAEFQKGVDLSHNDPVARAYLARCYAASHREREAREILISLEKASEERYISAAEIAAIHASLSDTKATLDWLDKAIDEQSSALIYLNVDRVFDPLRSDPRFEARVERMHLPPVAGTQQTAAP